MTWSTIAHALPHYPMELSPGVGVRHPAFCTAAGRAILATFDDGALDQWLAELKPEPFTKFTPTDLKAIRKCITDARDKGYGETHQDMKLGDCGLAVAAEALRRPHGRRAAGHRHARRPRRRSTSRCCRRRPPTCASS